MSNVNKPSAYFNLESVNTDFPAILVDVEWSKNQAFLELLQQSWLSQYSDYMGEKSAASLLAHLHETGKIYDHDAAGTLVASIDDQLVGVAAIRYIQDVSLVTLFEVIPTFHGKGIGHQLLSALCTIEVPLVAHVSIHRPWLKKFYEKHEFVEIGAEKVDHFGHALTFDVMVKV